jgi:endonuclease/exonuclease/phosphatase family metal-dependent hydrolase
MLAPEAGALYDGRMPWWPSNLVSRRGPAPRLSGKRAGIVLGGLLVLGSGCATARNYEDPAGPVYVGGAATRGHAAAALRVVTFNLKWGLEVDRAATLLSEPGPLRDADLLVLQEMDQPGTEKLARALGYFYVYVPSAVHPVPDRDFGVALLSPWPLEDPGKLQLPHEHEFRKLRRAAAVATLRAPLGPVRVYGVHFESPTGASGSVRRDQARAVVAHAATWEGPVVVAGDFNGRGAPREMEKAGFTWATEPLRRTAGPFSFDHVLGRGLCPAGPRAAGVAEHKGASDHDPVWTVLTPCPHSS